MNTSTTYLGTTNQATTKKGTTNIGPLSDTAIRHKPLRAAH